MGAMTTTTNSNIKVGDRVLIFNRNPKKAWRGGIVLSMQDGLVTVEHKGGSINTYMAGAVKLPTER
jgi:hypothetical protein